jgi:hypothetical protein
MKISKLQLKALIESVVKEQNMVPMDPYKNALEASMDALVDFENKVKRMAKLAPNPEERRKALEVIRLIRQIENHLL